MKLILLPLLFVSFSALSAQTAECFMSKDDYLQHKNRAKKVPRLSYNCVRLHIGGDRFQGWLNKKSDITINNTFDSCSANNLAGINKFLTQEDIDNDQFDLVKNPLPLMKKCNQQLNTSTSYIVRNCPEITSRFVTAKN